MLDSKNKVKDFRVFGSKWMGRFYQTPSPQVYGIYVKDEISLKEPRAKEDLKKKQKSSKTKNWTYELTKILKTYQRPVEVQTSKNTSVTRSNV